MQDSSVVLPWTNSLKCVLKNFKWLELRITDWIFWVIPTIIISMSIYIYIYSDKQHVSMCLFQIISGVSDNLLWKTSTVKHVLKMILFSLIYI